MSFSKCGQPYWMHHCRINLMSIPGHAYFWSKPPCFCRKQSIFRFFSFVLFFFFNMKLEWLIFYKSRSSSESLFSSFSFFHWYDLYFLFPTLHFVKLNQSQLSKWKMVKWSVQMTHNFLSLIMAFLQEFHTNLPLHPASMIVLYNPRTQHFHF